MKGARALIIKEPNRQCDIDILNAKFDFIKFIYLRHAVRDIYEKVW